MATIRVELPVSPPAFIRDLEVRHGWTPQKAADLAEVVELMDHVESVAPRRIKVPVRCERMTRRGPCGARLGLVKPGLSFARFAPTERVASSLPELSYQIECFRCRRGHEVRIDKLTTAYLVAIALGAQAVVLRDDGAAIALPEGS